MAVSFAGRGRHPFPHTGDVISAVVWGFKKKDIIFFSDEGHGYAAVLALVVLLFCIYMITQQRNLSGLSRALFKEKEAAHMLSQNVKTLSSLMEVSSVINSEQKLSGILDIITKEMLICFQADQSSVMLLDKQSR